MASIEYHQARQEWSSWTHTCLRSGRSGTLPLCTRSCHKPLEALLGWVWGVGWALEWALEWELEWATLLALLLARAVCHRRSMHHAHPHRCHLLPMTSPCSIPALWHHKHTIPWRSSLRRCISHWLTPRTNPCEALPTCLHSQSG